MSLRTGIFARQGSDSFLSYHDKTLASEDGVQAVGRIAYSSGCRYILLICFITKHIGVLHFCDISAWVGCWSPVSIRMIIHNALNVFPFYYTTFAVSGKVGIQLNRLNQTSLMTVVTPTDRAVGLQSLCYRSFLVAYLCCLLTFIF